MNSPCFEPDRATDRLSNGLRVIARSRPHSQQFAAVLAFGSGHLDDPHGLPGLAHLAEHLAFCGSTQDLVEQASRAGAYVNAYAGPDRTVFIASGHADLELKLLAILSRMLCRDSPTDSQLQHEKRILAHELFPLDPWDAARDRFANRLCGDRNWNLRAAGLLERINRISTADVERFRLERLCPANACLAVVSSRPEAVVEEDVRRMFGVEWADSRASVEPRIQSSWHAPATCTPFRSPQCVVGVWSRTIGADWPTSIVARMAADALGGGPHSRLYRELRERRGLAYYVHSGDSLVGDVSTVVSTAHVSRAAALTAVSIILDETQNLRSELLNEAHFSDTKRRLRREFEVFTEDAAEMAQFLAYRGVRHADHAASDRMYLAGLESLTMDQAQEVLNRFLEPGSICTHVVGGINPLRRFLLRRAVARR